MGKIGKFGVKITGPKGSINHRKDGLWEVNLWSEDDRREFLLDENTQLQIEFDYEINAEIPLIFKVCSI